MDERYRTLAREAWQAKAKPLGSLGVLEDQVVQICALQETLTPSLKDRAAVIFCADNGVVEEGVTQTGQEVTRIVCEQISAGRSSVNRMAAVAGCRVLTVDAGMAPHGTANLRKGPAMTQEQFDAALALGRKTAYDLADAGVDLLAAGEMGIGNTTTASAVAAVLLGKDPAEVTGKGAGLTDEALKVKVEVIRDAIAVNAPDPKDAAEVLRTLGGLDLTAMCGFYLGAAERSVPVLMDGFPSAVAALCAARMEPNANDAILAAHVSAEPAGQMVVAALGKTAPIQAGLRLGEGTGAVAAIPLLDMALAVFNESYTFEEGGIDPYQPL